MNDSSVRRPAPDAAEGAPAPSTIPHAEARGEALTLAGVPHEFEAAGCSGQFGERDGRGSTLCDGGTLINYGPGATPGESEVFLAIQPPLGDTP